MNLIRKNRIIHFQKDIIELSYFIRLGFAFSQILNAVINGNHNLTLFENKFINSYLYRNLSYTSVLGTLDYIKSDKPYLLKILIASDQFLNVLLFNGSHKETISSNIARQIDSSIATKFQYSICKILRKLESKHCIKSLGE